MTPYFPAAFAAAALFVGYTTVASAAHGQVESDPAELREWSEWRAAEEVTPPEEPPKHWYGAPILIIGGLAGAALGAEVIVALNGNEVPAGVWVPTALVYGLTGPIVHAAHQETGRMFASIGLNVGAPLGGFLLGFSSILFQSDCDSGLPHDEGEPCSRVPALVLIEAGFIAGPVFDGLLLARRPVKHAASVFWTPAVFPASADGRGGAALGVVGSF